MYLASLRCYVCGEKRGGAAFPLAAPRHEQAAAADRGRLTPDLLFLLGDRPPLLSISVLSGLHPGGAADVGTWRLKSWHSGKEIKLVERMSSGVIICLSAVFRPLPVVSFMLSFYLYTAFPGVFSCFILSSCPPVFAPPMVDSFNWPPPSVMHWLWSPIKELLIDTLFNIGLCSAQCPLMQYLQQPLPVSTPFFNVINYDGRLGRFFPPFFLSPFFFKHWEGGKSTEDELEGKRSVWVCVHMRDIQNILQHSSFSIEMSL